MRRPSSAARSRAPASSTKPKITYEVSALKTTHDEKLLEQQVPWRLRGLQVGVDEELNKLQSTQDVLQTRQMVRETCAV